MIRVCMGVRVRLRVGGCCRRRLTLDCSVVLLEFLFLVLCIDGRDGFLRLRITGVVVVPYFEVGGGVYGKRFLRPSKQGLRARLNGLVGGVVNLESADRVLRRERRGVMVRGFGVGFLLGRRVLLRPLLRRG